MNRKTITILLAIVASFSISTVYAQPFDHQVSTTNNMKHFSIDWSKCNPHCYEYVPNHDGRTNSQANQPQRFDIYMPDWTCNISGTTNIQTGDCSAPAIVLSPLDWINLQNDIGVFAVRNIAPTNLPQNVDYCDLANFTWVHQDATFKTKYNITNVVPAYCLHDHVHAIPEFGVVAGIALVIAVGSMIFLNKNSGPTHSR